MNAFLVTVPKKSFQIEFSHISHSFKNELKSFFLIIPHTILHNDKLKVSTHLSSEIFFYSSWQYHSSSFRLDSTAILKPVTILGSSPDYRTFTEFSWRSALGLEILSTLEKFLFLFPHRIFLFFCNQFALYTD